MAEAAQKKFDVYQHVTDTILAEIEKGCVPWRKPWSGARTGLALPKRVTGDTYRGINVLMLWLTAATKGYASPTWMTYRQAQELGGQVRKGEKSATVVKFGSVEKDVQDSVTGDSETVQNASTPEPTASSTLTRSMASRRSGTCVLSRSRTVARPPIRSSTPGLQRWGS
jgi:antirestriction protein ArdC